MFCLDHDLLLQIERRQIHRVGARTTFGNRMLNMWEDGQTAAVWLRELLQLNPAMNLSCFVAGWKLDIIQFRQPDMPDISLVLQ